MIWWYNNQRATVWLGLGQSFSLSSSYIISAKKTDENSSQNLSQ